MPESCAIFFGRSVCGGATKGFFGSLIGCEPLLEDSAAKIAELLQSFGRRSAVFVNLRQEKSEERLRNFKRIGYVFASVFVDCLLVPGIETMGGERVVLCQKDLRCRHDDSDFRGICWSHGPNGDSVIRVRPE